MLQYLKYLKQPYELCDLGRGCTQTRTFSLKSSPLMNILIVPPQKESVASFLRGHQHWAVQAFCINNKFIMHECGPLLRIDEWIRALEKGRIGLQVKENL